MDDRRWRDPEWLDQVRDWIDGRLDELGVRRTGPAVQPHVYPWSTVLRVPTDRGDVWFKANADSLRHEAGVVQRIAARRPDAAPPLLATDTAAGWMLMADGGETLRVVTQRERSLDRWRDVLPRYAGVQLDLADDVDDLLALGLPDRRLATLPEAYARIVDEVGAPRRLRDAVPMVAELCAELAEYGLPELLHPVSTATSSQDGSQSVAEAGLVGTVAAAE
ncbi:hypothetical protein [Micromonospora sp. LOL_015]|uniref:hypothetical protein n=1 Tax=Micromonospora sp. LOL_015 TaxID=3345416 RepID=UPI003A86B858